MKNCCYYILLASFLIFGCESTVVPIANTGKEYSVYGPLDLQKTPNYIRVYDTKKLLTPEATENLDVEVRITNLATMDSEIMEDQVVIFDNIYTHNYKVEMPIEFNSRYKIEWEDIDGFSGSLTTVTPRQTELTVLVDSVECGEDFLIHLSNINLDAGEQLIAEAGIKIGQNWFWTSRQIIYEYSSTDHSLIVGWNPSDLINLIFGMFSEYNCNDITSNKLQFSFTHIGYMEGIESTPKINLSDSLMLHAGSQIVLSKYSGGAEINYIPDLSDNILFQAGLQVVLSKYSGGTEITYIPD